MLNIQTKRRLNAVVFSLLVFGHKVRHRLLTKKCPNAALYGVRLSMASHDTANDVDIPGFLLVRRATKTPSYQVSGQNIRVRQRPERSVETNVFRKCI